VRGILLMAISNRTGTLVLASGNKSEIATGYCTLYGDTVGGFAVIKDVPKTSVYALARWRNEHDVFGNGKAPIPERIITRAPSAELREGQTDQDNLPPYDVLDAILERYMEQNQSVEDIVNAGYTREDVEKVVRLIKISEYKRQQAPLGTKVSARSFGADWRYPITSKYQA
ncbi:MAG: NAD(+) synthase, partial [Saezia sp.]